MHWHSQAHRGIKNGSFRIRPGQHKRTDDGEPAPRDRGVGYATDHWYADEGVSGKVSAAQRPQFAKMLSQIRSGETLVVTKLDRLGCDVQDIGATIKALATHRIEVIVLQLGKLDLTRHWRSENTKNKPTKSFYIAY